ncbi:CCE_0567 family metalloprotein [Candidatus Protofrankia californiensis]|uniref:CCE_0567 family metalloprotein n=1 Tax=Candidatus Protofrankia californiensis TaxID=1839754 RepID=UPI001F49AC42|nr:CCE_0567 family metalloprotein [Candidatus Protofrankia californiensis]
MTTPDEIPEMRTKLKKLNSLATRLKLDLHDLAEDLPIGWERILETATSTYNAYVEIHQIERELAKVDAR